MAGGWWSKESSAGVVMDEDNVVGIDTILACVRVLAESVATLPLELYQGNTDDQTIKPAYNNPVYDLVRWQANEETTAYELRFHMMVDSIIRGYGVAQVIRTNKGRPLQLWPLYARWLYVRRAPDDGRLIYEYRQNGVTKDAVMLEMDEVLIIKSFCHGGLLGSSLVRLSADTLGDARAAEDYASEFFRNGQSFSGAIEVPDELSDEAYERLKKDWRETHTGTGQRHKAPILEGGAKLTPLSLDNQESQLLETRQYKRSTLAGLFRVPAHFINDLEHATFSNVEHLDLSFAKHTLRPWLTNWEQRLRMTLLNSGEKGRYFFVHDLTDLLRGDLPSRFTAYSQAVQAGILSPNDCRRRENLNPYQGGDTYLVQGALRDINAPVPTSAPTAPSKTKPTKAEMEQLIERLLS